MQTDRDECILLLADTGGAPGAMIYGQKEGARHWRADCCQGKGCLGVVWCVRPCKVVYINSILTNK